MRLTDGSRVSVNITDKEAGRCTVGLARAGLASAEHVERWRAFWKARLSEL